MFMRITFIALVVAACTPQARRDALSITLDVMKCVVAEQGETDEKVYAKCARDNVSKEDVLRMLSEARASTAAAAKAASCK